ncbi:hypothetical protein RB213_015960 [Colletotrichum asianum]
MPFLFVTSPKNGVSSSDPLRPLWEFDDPIVVVGRLSDPGDLELLNERGNRLPGIWAELEQS